MFFEKALLRLALCLLIVGCGVPSVTVRPHSWDDPFWDSKNYSRKEPNSIIVTNTDINRPYKEVAIIQTTGRPKDEKEAFRLMRKQLATLGVDAVIKVRIMENRNYEGVVILFD